MAIETNRSDGMWILLLVVAVCLTFNLPLIESKSSHSRWGQNQTTESTEKHGGQRGELNGGRRIRFLWAEWGGENGSGGLFVAFSTANPGVVKAIGPTQLTMLPNHLVDSLFDAVVDATDGAIVNTLIASETMTGADGYTVPALPHDKLVEILKQHDRLTNQ